MTTKHKSNRKQTSKTVHPSTRPPQESRTRAHPASPSRRTSFPKRSTTPISNTSRTNSPTSKIKSRKRGSSKLMWIWRLWERVLRLQVRLSLAQRIRTLRTFSMTSSKFEILINLLFFIKFALLMNVNLCLIIKSPKSQYFGH